MNNSFLKPENNLSHLLLLPIPTVFSPVLFRVLFLFSSEVLLLPCYEMKITLQVARKCIRMNNTKVKRMKFPICFDIARRKSMSQSSDLNHNPTKKANIVF